MIRKMLSLLKAAVSALVRVLERGWDGVWRWALAPVRALVGEPSLQPEEVRDAQTEAQLAEVLLDEQALVHQMSLARSAAKLAAVVAERESELRPAKGPELDADEIAPQEAEAPPQMTPSQRRWQERIALHAMRQEDVERENGRRIQSAMRSGDLTVLCEEERAALECVDRQEWDDLVEATDLVAVSRKLDELVRTYARMSAIHDRLEREDRLDDYPEPRAGFGM